MIVAQPLCIMSKSELILRASEFWHWCVQANREAPTLEFKSGRDLVRSNTTAALAAKFSPENDMEEEVAELLRAAGAHTGEAVEEAEEALALKVFWELAACSLQASDLQPS